MEDDQSERQYQDKRKAGSFGSGNAPMGGVGAAMRGGFIGGPTTNLPQTIAPISGRLEELSRNVEALNQSVGILEERLALALAPTQSASGQAKDNDRADSTQLGVILNELSSRIRSVTYRVNDITQRVEL